VYKVKVLADNSGKWCGSGVSAPEINEYGNVANAHNTRVPYQWHAHWNDDKPLTMGDLLSGRPLLAHDSHEGEWLSNLIDRIAQWVSLKPAAVAVELPEYIRQEETQQ